MTIRSGLAAQIGFAAESTFGTRVVPTRFLEFVDESISFDIGRMEGKGLRAGRRVTRSDRWAASKKSAGGSVSFEVHNKGFGLLFKHALGAVAITTPSGGTNSRDHTHTVADPFGLALTCQVGRPDIGGTVRPFDYLGCKVVGWELSNSVDDLLMLSLDLDARDEDTGQSLAAASYPASTKLLHWVGGSFTIAAATYELTSVSFKGESGEKTDRYFIGATSPQLKKEPIAADELLITAEVESEFIDMTAYNRYRDGATAQIVGKWEGDIIEGALKYHVEVTIPVARTDGETPNVGGPDIVPQKLSFKALDDGTNSPITIVYRTTDTAS